MPEEIPYDVRASVVNFDDFKIFAKMLYCLVKFDDNHNGYVGRPVQPVIRESCQEFVQEYVPESPRMM